jgi:hypothetical protein
MISTHIYGGLGNQLFQYSAGRALSLQHGVNLRLIWSGGNNKSRALAMMHFNVNCKIFHSAKLSKRFDFDVIKNFLIHGPPVIFCEKMQGFDDQFNSLGVNVRLKGYWQSEKFFKTFASVIRKDLQIVTLPTKQNQLLSEKILSKNSVAVHIRRGDYITDSSANTIHGTCSIEYYKGAMDYIATKSRKQTIFYIFSDDIPWAMENLITEHEVVFVDHNNDITNYEDLRLMSQCKHNIIANSSFSWWGAWLNINPQKIVITPQKWYADNNTKNEDLIPSNWMKI